MAEACRKNALPCRKTALAPKGVQGIAPVGRPQHSAEKDTPCTPANV